MIRLTALAIALAATLGAAGPAFAILPWGVGNGPAENGTASGTAGEPIRIELPVAAPRG